MSEEAKSEICVLCGDTIDASLTPSYFLASGPICAACYFSGANKFRPVLMKLDEVLKKLDEVLKRLDGVLYFLSGQ